MWDFLRNLFNPSQPTKIEKTVEPIEEQKTIEYGSKEGMPEDYWRKEVSEAEFAQNPDKGTSKSPSNLSKIENSSTSTKEESLQSIDSRIKSIIEAKEKSTNVNSNTLIDQENATKNPIENLGNENPSSSITEIEKSSSIEGTENVGENPSTGGGGGGFGGGIGGGGGGGNMNLFEREKGPFEDDEPLSQNQTEDKNQIMDLLSQDSAKYLGDNANQNTIDIASPSQEISKEDIVNFLNDKILNDTPSVSEQGLNPNFGDNYKNNVLTALNEFGDKDSADKEDYFPVDKSATLDFANSKDDIDVDMDVDGTGVADMGFDGGDD